MFGSDRGRAAPPAARLAAVLAVPVGAVALMLLVPLFTDDLGDISFVPTIVVAVLGAMHVWLMLRIDLLSLASPPCMALGGYATALLALHLTTNAVVAALVAFALPALVALVLGLLLLRLRGTYFALVTFAFAQVVVLAIGNSRELLGGTSGLIGIPALTLGSTAFATGEELLRFSVLVGMIGVGIAALVAFLGRRHLAAIHDNEVLAASLGLRAWLYKVLTFSASAGVAGLGGLVLVNQLAISQPTMFAPLTAIDHVAGAVLGGTPTALGPVLGAGVFAITSRELAESGAWSQVVIGLGLVVVVSLTRNGLSGVLLAAYRLVRGRRHRPAPDADVPAHLHVSPDDPADPDPEPADGTVPAGAAAGTPLLRVRELSRAFGGVRAVDALSFEVAPGEVLAVVGPNGAGKTTLISMLAGSVRPSAGRIELDGRRVEASSSATVARLGVGRSFQQTSVFTRETVGENLARALAFSGGTTLPDGVRRLYRSTGLADQVSTPSADLPYGLQKVLGLLMTLATRPRLLLLDEPAAGLEISERRVIDEIARYAVEQGMAVLLVEHDVDLVRRVSSRVLVMDAGRLLAEGDPDTVFRDPAVIRAYLGEAPADLAPGLEAGRS